MPTSSILTSAIPTPDQPRMKIAVTGGGTGGHIYPALAVAEALQRQGCQVLYIGKTASMESELVPERGIAFTGVPFFGMPRRPGLRLIQWFFALQKAKKQAKALLEDFKPACVFGTGGYVSGPVLMAAKALNIPYLVHEPDAFPGMANRLMARKATVVTAAFADSKVHFKLGPNTGFHVTGNPIRQDLGHIQKADAFSAMGVLWRPDALTLLVFGGSQGARTLNQALIGALPTLLQDWGVQVIHLSGKNLYDETLTELRQQSPELEKHPAYYLCPFSQEMPILMAAADMALCRAGSLTLSETYVTGLPTILVPYPHAAADHQRKNAMASVQAGASMIIEDTDCSAERLLDILRPFGAKNTATNTKKDTKLADMQAAARRLAHPNATEHIVRLILNSVPRS